MGVLFLCKERKNILEKNVCANKTGSSDIERIVNKGYFFKVI
jgi:hypothetical protein